MNSWKEASVPCGRQGDGEGKRAVEDAGDVVEQGDTARYTGDKTTAKMVVGAACHDWRAGDGGI